MSTEIFTRIEAARYLRVTYGLRVTKGSLATSACRGGGPRMIGMGRYKNYRKCDLIEWARSRCSGLLESTSTPHNSDTGGLFGYHEDLGDLPDTLDYHHTGDPLFDEVTRIEEEGWDIDEALDKQQEIFNYRKALDEIKH